MSQLESGRRNSDAIATGAPGQAQYRALLVEDHLDLAKATAEFMGEFGLEVLIVSCGRDAISAAAAFRPDVVVSDMRLPDCTGLDVLRVLRTNLNPESTLFVLHTTMSDLEFQLLKKYGKASGVNLLLSKPITREKLQTLMSELETLRTAPSKARSGYAEQAEDKKPLETTGERHDGQRRVAKQGNS